MKTAEELLSGPKRYGGPNGQSIRTLLVLLSNSDIIDPPHAWCTNFLENLRAYITISSNSGSGFWYHRVWFLKHNLFFLCFDSESEMCKWSILGSGAWIWNTCFVEYKKRTRARGVILRMPDRTRSNKIKGYYFIDGGPRVRERENPHTILFDFNRSTVTLIHCHWQWHASESFVGWTHRIVLHLEMVLGISIYVRLTIQ